MSKHPKARRGAKNAGSSKIPAKFARLFEKQRATARQTFLRKQAQGARDSFRPRKSDRGKIIFVGVKGQRNPTAKGRKGYPVYVTRTGKKWVIRQHGEDPYKARPISELLLPDRPNLRRAGKSFQSRRLVRIGRAHTITKKTGSIRSGGAHDFNNVISDRIAGSIRSALTAQASHRVFLIKFIALVRLPDGTTETIQGEVPIARPDHIAIKLAGIRNFVRQKFYSFMARELAFAGYVSNGSANHIRRLEVNRGKSRDQWRDRRGELWAGRKKEQVEIIKIDWTVEQAK